MQKENVSAENGLNAESLCKNYGADITVDNVSFRVKPGQILGLLGPNGSGKTTIMRILVKILQPDSGQVTLNGTPLEQIAANQFGYLPEERGLYPRAKVLDTLVYFGTLNQMPARKAQVEAIRFLDRLGLVEFTEARLNQLSLGVQQKVQLVASFLHNPPVVVLDEPFSGMDAINMVVLEELLAEFKSNGKIVILSTHQMDRAEKFCDNLLMMNQGRVLIEGAPFEIKKQFRESAFYIEADEPLPALKNLKNIEILEENNNAYKFITRNQTRDISALLNQIDKRERIRKVEVFEPSLHDIFIRLIRQNTGVK